MLLLSNADVAQVLDIRLCLQALEDIFQEIGRGDAVGMGREDVYIPSGLPPGDAPYYRWAIMTGGSKQEGLLCARMLSDMVSWPRVAGRVREDKYAREPGTYCGLLFLYSTRNAEPLAMLNDGTLQHDRVAGGAALGVKYLAREDSHVVGMVGTGGMARAYIDAFKLVRDITHVKVFSPNPEHVDQYVRDMTEKHGIDVEPVGSSREAVRGVDIAALCTSSVDPVFFPEWLEPGMHVADVGRASTPLGFIDAVDVAARPGASTPYLGDLPPEAFYARGGFLGWVAGQPEEREVVPHLPLPRDVHDLPRLPDLMEGRVPGRTSPEQTTWFLNVGAIGEQFAAVAAAVYRQALARGLGTEIPTDWFLQDIRD